MFPVIDVLNGLFLSLNYSFPIGILYRFFFFLFLLVGILRKGLKKTRLTVYTALILVFVLSTLLLQTVYFNYPLSIIIADGSVLIKCLFWSLIPYYVYQRKETIGPRLSHLLIGLNVQFVLGLLVPYLLGVGNFNYENSQAGYKGFFFATNDVTFAFIILSFFSGWYLVSQFGKMHTLAKVSLGLLYSMNVFCFLIIGTKTGLVFCCLLTVYVLVQLLFLMNEVTGLEKMVIIMMLLIVFLFFLWHGQEFIEEKLAGVINRLTFFYYHYNRDLVRLLTSSRSTYLKEATTLFFNNKSWLFAFFFGFGLEQRLLMFGRYGLVEMDFFDTFFSLGAVNLFIISVAFLFYNRLNRQRKNNIFGHLFLISLTYSFFVGHVLYSALSSTLFGLICSGIIVDTSEQQDGAT